MRTALEALAFSSTWIALTAAALCAAASRAMAVTVDARVLIVAALGTFVVYNVDRLRDLDRDRVTSPRRTAFVEGWEGALRGATALAALGAAIATWQIGPRTLGVLAPVLALGLFHRRLKRFDVWKVLYVTLAWTAVTAGLPALVGEGARDVAWVAFVLANSIAANAILSNLRDGEAATSRLGEAVPRRLALAFAALALVASLLAPDGVALLAAIPGLTGLAVLLFRPEETYGLVVVDGALLAGAALALAL